MRIRLIIGMFALLAAACGPPSDTVIVELCGDVQIPEDIDSVRVSILAGDRSEHRNGTLDLLNCGSEKRELPQTYELDAPVDDVWVVAQGLQDGVEVLHSERRLKIEETGRAQTALLVLTRSCMRITCALGQMCIDGACAQVPFPEDEVSCSGGAASGGAGGNTRMCMEDAP